MNLNLKKWIVLAYCLVGLAWIIWFPFRSVESSESNPTSISVNRDKNHGVQILEGDNLAKPECGRCHAEDARLNIDYQDPACLECHMAEELTDEGSPTPGILKISMPPSEGSDSTSMIHIPAGTFLMGSEGRAMAEGKGNVDEQPLRSVFVKSFYIDQYEVTNLQFKKFVEETDTRPPRHWKSGFPVGKENHPVIYISWFEANDYCHWVGKRLPTEAEWEKAARGTEGWRFPWGDTFDPMKANTPQRWIRLQQEQDTMPVGSFENGKSPYGLYDMAGNVYEWTANWYKAYPGNAVPNQHYGEKNRIVKGGSYYDCLSYGCGLSAPTFNRTRFAPVIRNKSFGFRCAKNFS